MDRCISANQGAKKLIINADDYGPNKSVCDAIIKCFELESISSTSVIVNFESCSQNILPLVDRGYPSGVHLNVFTGNPLSKPSDIPSLVNDSGQFRRFESVNAMNDQVDSREIQDEFCRQIDWLYSKGANVTHLDNHRPEIYFMPKLFNVVLDVASKYLLPIRLPFGRNFERYISDYSKAYASSEPYLMQVSQEIIDKAKRMKIQYPDDFAPQFILLPPTLPLLESIINGLAPGITELCTHPSFETKKGKAEFDALTNFNKGRLQKEFGVQLISFRDLIP